MAGHEARDTKLAAELALRTHSLRPFTDIVYVEGSHIATRDAVRVDLAKSHNVHGGVIVRKTFSLVIPIIVEALHPLKLVPYQRLHLLIARDHSLQRVSNAAKRILDNAKHTQAGPTEDFPLSRIPRVGSWPSFLA
jgi:hypothetical protein